MLLFPLLSKYISIKNIWKRYGHQLEPLLFATTTTTSRTVKKVHSVNFSSHSAIITIHPLICMDCKLLTSLHYTLPYNNQHNLLKKRFHSFSPYFAGLLKTLFRVHLDDFLFVTRCAGNKS